jgi:hypothetical protein
MAPSARRFYVTHRRTDDEEQRTKARHPGLLAEAASRARPGEPRHGAGARRAATGTEPGHQTAFDVVQIRPSRFVTPARRAADAALVLDDDRWDWHDWRGVALAASRITHGPTDVDERPGISAVSERDGDDTMGVLDDDFAVVDRRPDGS